MHLPSTPRILLISGLLLAIGSWAIIYFHSEPDLITTTAETGTVTTFVVASGNAQLEDVIPLSFPKGGTVSNVLVTRGDTVATGTILATIGDTALQADYAAALAEVKRTRAVRDELLNGQTETEATVTATTIKNAEEALYSTIKNEEARVETARTTLYNTGLTAVAEDPDTENPPPTITGSYVCTAEGDYTLELYRSGAESGYSYRYSGIETGTNSVYTEQPASLGKCGLRLQFSADEKYQNGTTFTISIPNTNSTTYAHNQALYEQARQQEEANINAARRTLDLALDQAHVATAGARVEQLIAANAVVAAAEARLTKAANALSDSAIRAPRSGLITDIDIVTGQTVATTPVITLFTAEQTTFTAHIPEKDITKISSGQNAEIIFDAMPDEVISAHVTYISPLQTIINGSPFYEVEMSLVDTPVWLRSGMQADVTIITKELTDTVRIPRLYLNETEVSIRTEQGIESKTVDVVLLGTDGFVAVSGLAAGSELVLPTEYE